MLEQEFLNQCQSSSQGAYEALKVLLNKIENENTRSQGIHFLHELFDFFKNPSAVKPLNKNYHFTFSELKVGDQTLKLLQLPSTFAPEEWSYTFFEGLTRYKKSEFEERTVVELGCGIGWITIALAMKTGAKKIYGLDINPKAVLCARLNLYLNGFDSNGQPQFVSGELNLSEIVEFHVSDLFEYCRNKKVFVDRVIGCIPQVLNPDPEFTSQMLQGELSESASDEFLHSLSNYAPQQGQIEDQFGLGLIAKAVEESVTVLKSTGKIILNLGGRPGKKVIEQLFLRRGFSIRQVWQTQVEQAKDTDIRALVEIESKSSHRFEFYIKQGGDTPISAHSALAYAEAGGKIAHGLAVYEATLRDPSHLTQVLKTLGKKGFEQARNAIDLSYKSDSLLEEKASFLSSLSHELEQSEYFPYQKTYGMDGFRKNLMKFFKYYFRIYWDENNIIIGPSRVAICKNLISIYQPKCILMDKDLVKKGRIEVSDKNSLFEIPQGSDLLCEMMLKLKPEMVIYSMPESESRSSDAFLRMIELSAQLNSRLFIDISELFELSSAPSQNGIFRYLQDHSLPTHVSLMCGLVKNNIYSDLKVSFLISSDLFLLENLINAAELTYSRTPFLSQFYYNGILNDLLIFHVIEKTSLDSRGPLLIEMKNDSKFIQVSKNAQKAFLHPAILGEKEVRDFPQSVRMDYGENCLPTPPWIKQLLFESFSHQNLPLDDSDPRADIIALVSQRWSLSKDLKLNCVLAGGVAPLFSEIASYCSVNEETILFPQGAYGYFVSSAEFQGAAVSIVKTDETRDFKINKEDLRSHLAQSTKRCWVHLCAPIVNPTGAIYNKDEILEIAKIISEYHGVLILDSIFSGLGFPGSTEFISSDVLSSCHWILLGGLSKEFSLGGLRMGYAVTSESALFEILKNCELYGPHKTLNYVLKKLYRERVHVKNDLEIQSKKLSDRARDLTLALSDSGWKVLKPQGGLFLIAKPLNLVGKKIKDITITYENLRSLLQSEAGVTINSPEWIGIPEYFRFVLSVDENDFQKAMNSIRDFTKKLI